MQGSFPHGGEPGRQVRRHGTALCNDILQGENGAGHAVRGRLIGALAVLQQSR
jgi:hypothetical protein